MRKSSSDPLKKLVQQSVRKTNLQPTVNVNINSSSKKKDKESKSEKTPKSHSIGSKKSISQGETNTPMTGMYPSMNNGSVVSPHAYGYPANPYMYMPPPMMPPMYMGTQGMMPPSGPVTINTNVYSHSKNKTPAKSKNKKTISTEDDSESEWSQMSKEEIPQKTPAKKPLSNIESHLESIKLVKQGSNTKTPAKTPLEMKKSRLPPNTIISPKSHIKTTPHVKREINEHSIQPSLDASYLAKQLKTIQEKNADHATFSERKIKDIVKQLSDSLQKMGVTPRNQSTPTKFNAAITPSPALSNKVEQSLSDLLAHSEKQKDVQIMLMQSLQTIIKMLEQQSHQQLMH